MANGDRVEATVPGKDSPGGLARSLAATWVNHHARRKPEELRTLLC